VLHNVLASDTEDSDFAPEEFTIFYQRSLYQSMRNLTGRVFQSLRKHGDYDAIVGLQEEVLTRFKKLIEGKIGSIRIRTHGDFHLGQLLFTGKDFVITDFEGEPLHPLSERRLKRSPLRDVAGMVRSFQYAAYSPLIKDASGIVVRKEDREQLEGWAEAWYSWVSSAFLSGYLSAAQPALLPTSERELEKLLDAYLLEKAIYEVGYELNNRPDWLQIPTRGLLQLLGKHVK
jgi:maltose alpha-D-glucosyltransferase / alpha-amylase